MSLACREMAGVRALEPEPRGFHAHELRLGALGLRV